VAIKASMNNGLPDELKSAFPGIIPVQRPKVLNCQIKDPNWLVGFASGEGSKKFVFDDFCKVAKLMDKAHLTKEGLDQIRKIKAGMNTGRK